VLPGPGHFTLTYCYELHKLENNFDGLECLHIMFSQTEMADELANNGSSRAIVPHGVFM
jgi:hypothetical protein